MKRPRVWLVAAGAVVLLGGGGGVAVAGMKSAGHESAAQGMGKAADSVKVSGKPAQGGKKPHPAPTTASPSSTPTATPTTPPPVEGTDVRIPLPGYRPSYGFADVLVDKAHGRVYITGGKDTDDLVVTDLDGGNPHKVADVAGAAGMTLSPDGSKLYVAASRGSWISIVDTTTFAATGVWTGKTDGTDTCPRDVAFAGGQLYFSWGCDTTPAGIGLVDPQTGAYELSVTEADGGVRSLIGGPARLATLPNDPNVVIAGETGLSPARLFRFEVNADSKHLLLKAQGSTDGGAVDQMAVTPDGSEVIIPSGSPYYHQVFRTSDLTVVSRYPTATYPDAVAIRSDGLVVAGTNSAYDNDIWVFEPGGTTPVKTYEFGHLPNQETWAHTLVAGGLAVNGDKLYAITDQSAEPDMVTLRIRDLPE